MPPLSLKMSFKNVILKLLSFGKLATVTAPGPVTKDLLLEFDSIVEEIHHEALADAEAAAASGTGPQAWDADWCENALDFVDEAGTMVQGWSWQHVQTFQEILDMALASPQGQRAQSMPAEVSNPWQDALEMIEGMKLALAFRSHDLLLKQSKELGNSQESQFELGEVLDHLLNPEAV